MTVYSYLNMAGRRVVIDTGSVRTNMGHQWTHDGDRALCLFCECSPLDSAAKAPCPERR